MSLHRTRRPGVFTVLALVFGSAIPGTALKAQRFDCFELNDGNTNIFSPPDACLFGVVPDADWCTCLRSAFTPPQRGMQAGFRQAILWILENPGIGNHRIEVNSGTLDLSGLAAGDVLGFLYAEELIPGLFPLVGGELFTVRGEVRVSAVAEARVEFEVVLTEVSPPVKVALTYDPLDATHSSGLLYTGVLKSLGPGKGFVAEYRYPVDGIRDDPPRFPAIEPDQAGSPTFSVPLRVEFFSAASGVYTLPDGPNVLVRSTLRGFNELALGEVLPLGAEDLCEEVAAPPVCKEVEETVFLSPPGAENRPPVPVLQVADYFTGFLLEEPITLQRTCGRAQARFFGRNSHDGDGGWQELSFEWSVEPGPPAAEIPENTRRFKDTEITFRRGGEYTVTLKVDDGGGGAAEAEASVKITVIAEGDENVPPTAVIRTDPDPPVVDLSEGFAVVVLDGSDSANGIPGIDDCGQELRYRWRELSGPVGGGFILSPESPVTEVRLAAPGTYIYELEVDDGAEEDNIDRAQVEVVVRGEPAPKFRRGDADDDGAVLLTDAVFILNWLFRSGPEPPCPDAADIEDSGGVNLTDAVRLLQYLFLGADPPAPPGPETCGPDRFTDRLGECRSERC